MYEKYAELRDSKGLTDYAVSKRSGVARSVLSDWRNGKHSPNIENLSKIAAFFGVSIEYLTTGQNIEKASTEGTIYYFDDDTAKKAQELFDNKDLRMLFDAARDASPKDLQMAADLLKRFKETNPDG